MTQQESDELTALLVKTQNRLRGRLAGLIESFGFDQKREAAMITTLKSITYDNERELVEALRRLR